MCSHVGINPYYGDVAIFHEETKKTIDFKIRKIVNGKSNVEDVKEMFQEIKAKINGKLGFTCIYFDFRIGNEIRKSIVKIGKTFGFFKIQIIDWGALYYLSSISQINRKPKNGDIIWLFWCNRVNKYCFIFEIANLKAKMVLHVLFTQEKDFKKNLEKKITKSKIPIDKLNPDILIYGKGNALDLKNLKFFFSKCEFFGVTEGFKAENSCLMKARIMAKDPEVIYFDVEMQVDGKTNIKINEKIILHFNGQEVLPLQKVLSFISKEENVFNIFVEEKFRQAIKLVPLNRNTPQNQIKIEIDLNKIITINFFQSINEEKNAKAKNDEVRREKEEQMKLEYEEEVRQRKCRYDETMRLMHDEMQIQKDENKKLMKDIEDLMQAFTQTRNDFLNYVKEKPQQDIVVPENMEDILRKARDVLGLDTANYYNFAFIGQTKTGKSSLINAIRGIDDNHPDAAKVGITETTHKTEPYSFPDPKYKSVKIYDIPGAGTLTHNSDSYYKDKSLFAFDCLVILTQDTLGKAEIDFAVQSIKYNQPIAFVRSRCDIVLDNAKKKKEIKKVDQDAVNYYISEMSKFYVEEIKKANTPELCRVPCFFVSAFSLRDLINGEEPEAVYHEQAFLDYIKAKSMFSRNIIY